MIATVLESFANLVPPAWVRKAEAVVMMGVFAEAFDVEPPSLGSLSADDALLAYRRFTAACMQEALVDERVAACYRERLGSGAMRLGLGVRKALGLRPDQALMVAKVVYRGIGIELSGSIPGRLTFGPCSFAQCYTPGCCWLMSSFDEGFMRGLSGRADARLEFSCRLTDGSPCCQAQFG